MMESPSGTRSAQADALVQERSSGEISRNEAQDAMQGETMRQMVRVVSPQGLHMRPIMAFVQTARNFQSNVVVSKDGRQVDGKSMFEMMTMVAPQGEELALEATGPDASAAITALADLIANTSFDDEDEQPLPPKG